MTILGIETSCDETAISLVRGRGGLKRPSFEVLSHIVSSQTKLHAAYGGVVPMLAKREHGKNLVPVLLKALIQAGLNQPRQGPTLKTRNSKVEPWGKIEKILKRETELLMQFQKQIPKLTKPKIDAIGVTAGPGLEPALWTGINFARALSLLWHKPIVPVNHLEGHIVSVLADEKSPKRQMIFPTLALIVSGGHTELVLMHDWFRYQLIGETRDDAAGEAFDKAARLLDLPYPGGPALAALAAQARQHPEQLINSSHTPLPRPMINTSGFDFSFSGLKTSLLYQLRTLKDNKQLTAATRLALAADFEQAIIDVLIKKTLLASERYRPLTLVAGGGVLANRNLRSQLSAAVKKISTQTTLLIPQGNLNTDNATMIAMAAYLRLARRSKLRARRRPGAPLKARGRLILK